MRKYEITYLLVPEMSEEAVNGKIEEYKALVLKDNGQVVSVNNLGKKRMAYEINGKLDAYYIVMVFTAESAVADELRRVMKNSDEVLRSLAILLD
ncbi:30S ribosomal protein S6 [bacterium]|nr:30S ribosomal protein S6 [bacterium]